MAALTLAVAGVGLAASTFVVTATSRDPEPPAPAETAVVCVSMTSGYERVSFYGCAPKREQGVYPKGVQR